MDADIIAYLKRLNRTFMELKLDILEKRYERSLRLNRTFMELKQRKGAFLEVESESLNRTFMELKLNVPNICKSFNSS